MVDLGVPLFQETSIWDSHIHELGVPRFGTFFVVFHILGMSSSQLLLSQSFFRGVAQPKKQRYPLGNIQKTMEHHHF